MAPQFDVFLCHNSCDEAEVKAVGLRLRELGLNPWLYEWHSRPGQRWRPELERQIDQVGAAAIFVGTEGIGPWQNLEIDVFLSKLAKRNLPLIPVLLPSAPSEPELPEFLSIVGWVKFGAVDSDPYAQLYWGITGRHLGERQVTHSPVVLPPHNLPFPSLGDLFKGRERELAELARDLGQPAALVQAPTLAGLGGVGKTRLAVEFAWRNADRYRVLLFVSAASAADLERGLAALAAPDLLALGLPEGLPEAEVAARVVRELRQRADWLLILDNVDELEAQQAVKKLLPLGGGKLLITSRLQAWPTATRKIGIETLEPTAAAEFLLEATEDGRARAADDDAQAEQLAERLGYLPLALELTASYLRIRHVAFRDLLADWERRLAELSQWHDQATTDYPRPLALAWERTFEHLTPGARALLQLLGHLAPAPIDEAMLETSGEDLAADVPDLAAALAELARYSLIARNPEADCRTLVVHRLVQEVARQRIPEADRSEWVEKAVGLVMLFSPENPDDVRTWPIWDPLRPHAHRVLELAETHGVKAPAYSLMNQLGLLLKSKASYGEAEPLLRRALEIAKANLFSDHPDIAVCLNNLAQLLQATNRFAEAEPLMRRALAIDEAIFGGDKPAVAISLNNLARLLQDTNRLAEAEPLMRRALAIDEASFGDDHHNTAIRLNNLATLLQATNRFAEAEPLMRRALAIDKASFGDDHPNVARHFSNLTTLLQATNRLAEAEPLARRALAIDEVNFGKDHPSVAIDLNNLAQLLQATNRLAEAEPLMRRAFAINEASFGEDHPSVAIDLNNLAQLLQATNRLAEAEPLMRRALAIDEASFGVDHPRVATQLNNLALLLKATNRLAEAEPLMRRALAIDEASFGRNHPDVARDLNNLARLLKDTNRLAEAEPLSRRALAIDEASFGDNHPDIARDLNNLALLLKDTNRLAEAELLMRRAVAIVEKSLTPGHPKIELVRRNLTALLKELGSKKGP